MVHGERKEDERFVCIDAPHLDRGRQLHLTDNSHLIDNSRVG